jgi:quinol---cytochrome-c reductase cytochrome c subunit
VEWVRRQAAPNRERESAHGGERERRELDEDAAVEQQVRVGASCRGEDCRAEQRERARDGEPGEQRMQLVHVRHGSAPQQRGAVAPVRRMRGAGGWVAVAAAAAGLLFIAAASPGPSSSGEPAAGGAVRGDGAALYLQNCASCHGPQGQGGAGGPSLVSAGAAGADFYLSTGRMPLGAPGQRPTRQQPRFDEVQIQALVDHVAGFDQGPPIPQVRGNGDVHRGLELYTANCAACHAATGVGNAVGGGFAAAGLGQATDRQIAEAMLIGPGVMPRFQFSDADRDAIIAYLGYLRTVPSPGGAPIGGVGPVAEGFVSVVLGLTSLVLIARFVGRRSHAGEPDLPTP